MPSKQIIRRELFERRRSLSEQDVHQTNSDVLVRALGLAEWESARRVHIYTSNSAWGEVDTQRLREALGQRYPRLIIETSAATKRATIPKKVYGIIIVPVLGFDSDGYRLGLGEGWYDRFLATQPQALKVGLAYSWSQLARLPHEVHDVPLDMILTERDIIRFPGPTVAG